MAWQLSLDASDLAFCLDMHMPSMPAGWGGAAWWLVTARDEWRGAQETGNCSGHHGCPLLDLSG
eukprot:1158114-Pelagomonas_calceolata.AAC.4